MPSNLLSQRLITAIFLLVTLSMEIKSQPFPDPPEPWRDVYNITLGDFEFSHPMTVMNSQELEIIKYRIENRIEPQYSAYNMLIAEAESQLNFQPDAPATMNIMGGYETNSNLDEMRDWLWRNGHAAYTSGLAYILSGETKYAEKAKEVLMDWANTGTTFTGADRGLQLGSWFSPMLYAADLIHGFDGWQQTDRDVFQSWWRDECLNSGDILGVLRRKDNNWKDAALLGTFAASVVLEDTLLMKEALVQLTSYFYARTDDNVRLPGKGWKIEKADGFVYLPREVVRNDGRSGLTYTAYALTTMSQAIEIARYAGFDFWTYQTEDSVSIKDVIEQYFLWDVKRETFPWNGNPNRSDKRRNVYELAATHLEINPEIVEWVQGQWPLISGREGDEYTTLTKGDINGTGFVPPSAPTNLRAVALSEDEVKVTWQDNSDDEDGFQLQRRTETGNYFTAATLSSNTTEFTDRLFLSDSTAYIYRILSTKSFSTSEYSDEVRVTTLPEDKTLAVSSVVEDTYVMEGSSSDDNFGAEPELRVSSIDDSTAHSFLKFRVSPDTLGEVTSAYIQLRAKSPGNSKIAISAASNNWSEETLTWNEELVILNELSEVQLSDDEDVYTWDVTGYLLEQIELENDISFCLVADTADAALSTFYSKESGVNGPELHIVRDKTSLTGIKVLSEATPSDFALNQNYPNPFNSSTSISFKLKHDTFTKLTVYDMVGCEVDTLVNKHLNAGFYEIHWSADHFPTGVYLLKLSVGNETHVKKMVLMK